jgi:hypothetical protein
VRDGALSEANEQALRQSGPRGLALAAAVARTAPAGIAAAAAGGPPARAPAASIGPPSEPGMGALFPLLLVATAGAALAFALSRRRRRPAR